MKVNGARMSPQCGKGVVISLIDLIEQLANDYKYVRYTLPKREGFTLSSNREAS